jgi:hypothetical protein
MIKILGNEDYTINYRCSCGVEGRCMVKPMSEEGSFIVDVRCPLCFSVERVKMVQYNSPKEKRAVLKDSEFSWAYIKNHEITKYFVAKERKQ